MPVAGGADASIAPPVSHDANHRMGRPHAIQALPRAAIALAMGLVMGLALPADSLAQVRGPGALPPEVRTLAPPLPDAAREATRGVDPLLRRGLPDRIDLGADLVRRHPAVLDTDRRGAPIVRSEVIAIDPTDEALARARNAGFSVLAERRIDELDLRIVVLQARPGMGTRGALRRLRRLDPDGSYDFNHLYLASGVGGGHTAAAAAVAQPAGHWQVGLIDGGVDDGHPALAGVAVQHWGCDGARHPEPHATAVASLLAGSAARTPHAARLWSADIYCGQATGGNALQLVEALAWLARERVGVVNISLVGPDNRLLARATASLIARGHVLVAAVGNDGPNAPPLYPAAYPGVIGVTGIDQRLRVLPEAVRGPQVAFAAPGAGLRAAVPGGDWQPMRGTSFAAPLVARLAAVTGIEPGPGAGEAAHAALVRAALPVPERDRRQAFGQGLLALDLVDGYAQATAPQVAR